MDASDHANSSVQTSERTLHILQTVLEKPGRTTKQLRRVLADAGATMSDQTLRKHLKALIDGDWVLLDRFGQHNPGPAVAGGAGLIQGFQAVLECLRQFPDGLTPSELAHQVGIDLHQARAAIGIGLAFNCIAEADTETGRYRLDADGLMLPPCTASDAVLNSIIEDYVTESGHDAALVRISREHGLVLSHFRPAPGGDSLLPAVTPDAAHATSGGQAVLSRLDTFQRHRYLTKHGLRAFTPQTPTSIDALEQILVEAPGHLYVAEGQFNELGACMAILVHNGPRTDHPVALTTSVYRAQLHRDRQILEVPLRRAATALLTVIDGPLSSPVQQ
ncbi:IclR family transcriptional regulator C-terminal domain-containing protein [Glycomyces sp. NPDC047010]|uniref:IclR family transcriptional regulator domain-containing protein n=1 Tax=Glycomyces sp. NPDC047010 TaxID=3155023 RepID=UPI0033E87119